MSTTFSATPARRALLAAWLGAAGILLAPASNGQTPQGQAPDRPVPGTAQQTPAPVDPQSVSCNDLKARVRTTGELSILVGRGNGWGDTFYGPSVPRCQFYQMPQFSYVRARDGLCGVGFICVDKLSMD